MGIRSVSYTHLDVYKRQVLPRVRTKFMSPPAICTSFPTLIISPAAGGGSWAKERAGGAFAAVIAFVPVSYTHLARTGRA